MIKLILSKNRLLKITLVMLFWVFIIQYDYGQTRTDSLWKVTICNYKSLLNENLANTFESKDLSNLFIEKNKLIGFIGSNYKRIDIYWNSIIKKGSKSNTYYIYGKSKTGENEADFQGELNIEVVKVYESNMFHYGVDDLYKGVLKRHGLVVGKYKLYENSTHDSPGVFSGYFMYYWYEDQNNILHFDNIQENSDSYRNSQFSGTWTSYKSGKTVECKFGFRRIPNCGDLDVGEGEFAPNIKYKSFGWEDF